MDDHLSTEQVGWLLERSPEAEAGRKLSDRQLERLIDQVIATNERAT